MIFADVGSRCSLPKFMVPKLIGETLKPEFPSETKFGIDVRPRVEDSDASWGGVPGAGRLV